MIVVLGSHLGTKTSALTGALKARRETTSNRRASRNGGNKNVQPAGAFHEHNQGLPNEPTGRSVAVNSGQSGCKPAANRCNPSKNREVSHRTNHGGRVYCA